MAGKDDGLGIPKPALKALIDSFKTISETFNDILQSAKDEDEAGARDDKGIAAAPKPAHRPAAAKSGNGRAIVVPPSRSRRPYSAEIRRS